MIIFILYQTNSEDVCVALDLFNIVVKEAEIMPTLIFIC